MTATFAVGTAAVAGSPDDVSAPVSNLWSPEDLGAKLPAWFDSTQGKTFSFYTGNYTDGGQITEWRSRVGSIASTRQGNQQTPGYPYARFNAETPTETNCYFYNDCRLAFPADSIPAGAAEGAVFAVVYSDSNGGNIASCIGLDPTSSGAGAGTFRAVGNVDVRQGGFRNGAPDTMVEGFTAYQVKRIISDIERPGVGLTRLDGGAGVATQSRTINTTRNALAQIGGFGASFYTGAIYELLYVTGSLTDDEIYRVEGYLAWKWNKQGDLPAAHAYKSAPPARTNAGASSTTGTAAGSATVVGQGTAIARSTGTVAAAAAVTGDGRSQARSTGSVTASSTVLGSSSALARSIGTASATATVSGASSTIARTTGTVIASASASGQGQSTATGVGSSVASTAATGQGQAITRSTGTVTSTATVTGTGANTTAAPTVGTASALASVAGEGLARAMATGTAIAVSTASGETRAIVTTTGTSSSTCSASGEGLAIVQSTGTAIGTAVATGAARSAIVTTGSAASSSAVAGESRVTARSTGTVTTSTIVFGDAPKPPPTRPPVERRGVLVDQGNRRGVLVDIDRRRGQLVDIDRRRATIAT